MLPGSEPNDLTPDQTEDQTRQRDDTHQEAVPIPVAVERLGLTTDAIRMRLKRGTLSGHKVDGRWVVFVPLQNTDSTPTKPLPGPNADTIYRQTQRATQRDQTWSIAADATTRELIEVLRSENAFLRDELTARTDEIRRRDHIIAGFIERIPELPATTAEATTRASIEDAHYGPSMTIDPSVPAPDSRPWWKRALGIK